MTVFGKTVIGSMAFSFRTLLFHVVSGEKTAHGIMECLVRFVEDAVGKAERTIMGNYHPAGDSPDKWQK